MQSLQTINFQSAFLNRSVLVSFLPPDTLTPDGHCATLYLLHGMGGDHLSWPTNTAIAELVAGKPILAVMPSAENSFYLDSEVSLMESHICDELVPYFDSRFPTIPNASRRGITGLSMGGYGALLLALRHPELFGSAASHSGAVLTSRAATEVGVKWDLADKLYGTEREGEIKRRAHDILFLAQKLQSVDSETGKLRYDGPDLYLDCGQSDFLFYASRNLTEALRMQQIPYAYSEFTGAHDWDYWSAHLIDSLNFHFKQFKI